MVQKQMAIKVELQMSAYLWDPIKPSGKSTKKIE